jgi:integrase
VTGDGRRTVAELVEGLREAGDLAPRTVRHIYGQLHARFRRAYRKGLVDGNPCALERHELPKKEDKDPTWRASAVFSRAEVEQVISDERLPEDRRALYAMMFLAGTRIGEALALRWGAYDAVAEPLGRLTVSRSWSTARRQEKSTKTRSTRHVPVHPTLAQVLAAWRL